MQNDPKREAKRWLLQAKEDFDDATFLKNGKRYNVACFLYQQAAEKALKAFLYYQGSEEVWGHSVAELCDAASEHAGDFSSFLNDAASLDKYYIPTRYPNGLPGGIPSDVFQEKDAVDAFSSCQKIIELVAKLTHLGGEGPEGATP